MPLKFEEVEQDDAVRAAAAALGIHVAQDFGLDEGELVVPARIVDDLIAKKSAG